MSRYLNEIRLGKRKQFFRDIIHDVREQFNLKSQKRPVPHITLFGPYNTSQGYKAKYHTKQVLSNYAVVPFHVKGFSSFPNNGVVYADVQPSKQLENLRRELASALIPLSYNYRSWDTDDPYEFHITIATNLGGMETDVLGYLRQNYQMDLDLYARRVTALDRRQMMWEWDLPRRTELSAKEATSQKSWNQTVTELQRKLDRDQPARQSNSDQSLFARLISWLS